MSGLRVIGVDPGPVPGIVDLHVEGPTLLRVEAIQCTAGTAAELVEALLQSERHTSTLLQVERFVVGRRSGRSATAGAGAATRDLIGQLQRVVDSMSYAVTRESVHLIERNAGQVKPWATDTRLTAAGLLEATKGMRHARDAGRHALFAAVHDAGLPDPLSSRFVR